MFADSCIKCALNTSVECRVGWKNTTSIPQETAPSINKLERCLGNRRNCCTRFQLVLRLHVLMLFISLWRLALMPYTTVIWQTTCTGQGCTPLASPPSVTHPHWRLLLESLCPLTHSAASETDELAPHSQPKAQELFETLVKGVQDRPWYMISPNVSIQHAYHLSTALYSLAHFLLMMCGPGASGQTSASVPARACLSSPSQGAHQLQQSVLHVHAFHKRFHQRHSSAVASCLHIDVHPAPPCGGKVA